MATSRIHHFVAQFYQRNFAEPMYSSNIRAFGRADRCWDRERITPRGIGWFRDLYSMIDDTGVKTDAFERYLSEDVEQKAAPAMKKAARNPDRLTPNDRVGIAMFIGVASARIPAMMNAASQGYSGKLSADRLRTLEKDVEAWCKAAGQAYTDTSRSEFLKPDLFCAIVLWSESIRDRILTWPWTFLQTERDRPFITSDWPVFMYRDEGREINLVNFPISSEMALLIMTPASHSRIPLGGIRQASLEEVHAMNLDSMRRAQEFVICRRDSFPGDDLLPAWSSPGGLPK